MRVRHAIQKCLRARGERAAREEQHRPRLLRGDLDERVEHVHPGHLRHHQVAEDCVESLAAPDAIERCAAARFARHVVLGLEHLGDDRQDVRLVVDDEHRSALRGGGRAAFGRWRHRLDRPFRRRERHADGRALARLALDLDATPEFGHDRMADGEAEARAEPHGLGREEGVEDAGQEVLRDPRARVAYLDVRPSSLTGGPCP
jgi:hypothetical protein